MTDYSYQFGGTLPLEAPSYVTREADEKLYAALKVGEFCYVLNSRQMGKSSLRLRTVHRLQGDNIACAQIDLTEIGTQGVSVEQWYAGIVRSLASQLPLAPEFKWRRWWRERREESWVLRLSGFIEEILTQFSQPMVICIDEIDSILGLGFPTDDFFALIRACHEKRTQQPVYQRLTFALFGVATPSDLVRDKRRTPFNIGTAIELEGFKLEQAKPLGKGLVGKVDNPQAIIEQVLQWTGGQPFLTQKVCSLVISHQSLVISEQLSVEEIVRNQIINDWEGQDEPEHLRTIQDRIFRNEEHIGRLLGLYQQVLREDGIKADGSMEQMELLLSGLVVKRRGRLQVANQIYQGVFNQQWIGEVLLNVRPYGEEIRAWLASQRQDESWLLRGGALARALDWAAGRSLSAEDDLFLNASQELDKQLIKAENIILAEATRKAKRRVSMAFAVLAMALAGAGGVGFWANNRVMEADEQIKQAEIEVSNAKAEVKNADKRVEEAKQAEQLAKQRETAANQQVIEAQQRVKEARQSIEEAAQQVAGAEQQQKRIEQEATQKINAANQQLATAQEEIAASEVEKARIEQETEEKIELANQEMAIANQEAAEAQQEQQEAEALRAATEKQRQIALREIEIARQATQLERRSQYALKQFQFQQSEALFTALTVGQELKSIVKKKP